MPGGQGLSGDGLVEMRGQADIHGFHLRIANGFFGAGVFGHRGEIELRAGATKIALNIREIAGEAAWVGTRHGGQLSARNFAPGLHVRAAHEAET